MASALGVLLCVLTLFKLPLFSGTIHYLDFFVAVVLEDPKCKSSKPIVKVTIQDQLGIERHANSTHESLELLLVDDIAPDRIVDVALPPYKVRARNVPLLICIFRVIVNFQNSDVWVV